MFKLMNFLYRSTFKLAVITFILFGIALIISEKSKAFTLSPASGNIASGATQTIEIRASNTSTNAVEIKLSSTNFTILSFTDGSGMLGLGTCAGNTKFTATTVCVDVASTSGNFTSGQVLGTITVRGNNAGTATLAAGAGSQYANGTAVTGTLGTYTIGTGTTTSGNTTSGNTTSGNTTSNTTSGNTTSNTTGTLPNTSSGSSSVNLLIGMISLTIASSLILVGTLKKRSL
jgi:hypothetical protein